jgi:GntR family transcriptional regulator
MRLQLPPSMGSGSGPLYQQITQKLVEKLSAGDFAPGQALPSERDLAQQFGVSIGTLRAAMNALVSEGILVRQQGRGTFVATHDRDRLRFYFFHIVKHDKEKQDYPEVKFDAFSLGKADADVAQKLQIARGAATIHIRNVLWLDGRPVLVDEITLPAAQFRGLTEEMVRTRKSTLYNLYQSAFGITVARSSERLRAATVSAQHTPLLAVEVGTPILQIRRVALRYDDTPVEWRVSHVNTALHEYSSELGA